MLALANFNLIIRSPLHVKNGKKRSPFTVTCEKWKKYKYKKNKGWNKGGLCAALASSRKIMSGR